jgi:hypothetical protein
MRVLYDEAVAEGEGRRLARCHLRPHERQGGSSSTSAATRTTCTRAYNRRAQEAGRLRLPDVVETGRGAAAVREAPREAARRLAAWRAATARASARSARRTGSRERGCGRALLHDPDPQGPVDSGPVIVPARRLPPDLSARALATD